MRGRLSPEDLAALAATPPDATPAELARALGRPYGSVHHALRRLRRAGGWYCPLAPAPCAECGLPVAGPRGRLTHVACAPARERRAWLTGAAPEAVERWGIPDPAACAARRARERAHAARYYRALPDEHRAALAATWRTTDRREHDLTRRAAERHYDAWTDADDRYVLEHGHPPAREVALALGRTTWAVRRRRWYLRHRGAMTALEGG